MDASTIRADARGYHSTDDDEQDPDDWDYPILAKRITEHFKKLNNFAHQCVKPVNIMPLEQNIHQRILIALVFTITVSLGFMPRAPPEIGISMLLKGTNSGAKLAGLPTALKYLFGLTLYGLALAARFALIGVLPPQGFPFLTFFPAVLITAYLAGLWPGLVVSALSIVSAWYFFIPPAASLTGIAQGDVVALIFFAGILVVDCIVLHLMNKALAEVRSTTEQLRESQERLLAREAALQEASQQKDVFLATLAHELRNPLAPISAAAQLIALRDIKDDTVKRCAAIIERQSAQLGRLVDDLLEVSRISSGKLSLQLAVLDLRVVIDTALEASQPLIEKANHRFTLAMPAEAVYVHMDGTRIAQCISNLLHNAVKFTPSPGEISLKVVVQRDDLVSITFKDNGRGISPEMLPKLFELFMQEHVSGMEGNSGLGIGLALTRSLIEKHNGKIFARSEGPGKGATFEILLPLAQTKPVPHNTATLEQPVHSSALVLIVDDNQDAVEMLKELLKIEGFHVLSAHNGIDALNIIKDQRPKIILLDIGLPDISGYEVAHRARNEHLLDPDTLLIALTGWSDEQSKIASTNAGIEHKFNKPVDLPRLLKLIDQHFQST